MMSKSNTLSWPVLKAVATATSTTSTSSGYSDIKQEAIRNTDPDDFTPSEN